MTIEDKINILKANDFELRDFPDFQNDKELVLLAIRHNPTNLKYVSPELKEDDEVLAEAIRNLDSKYWRKSPSGRVLKYYYDVDRFLDDMQIETDVLRGKEKTGEALIDSGYFDYDSYHHSDIEPPRLSYKDVFGEKFLPKLSEDGIHLEGIEESDALEEELDDIMSELDYCEEPDLYEELEAKKARNLHRQAYISARTYAWSKTVSPTKRLKTIAPAIICPDGPFYEDTRGGVPIAVRLEDILKDPELMKDEDLRRKIELFKEKCKTVTNYVYISCILEEGSEGKQICSLILGEYGLNASDIIYAYIDFKSGNISEYAGSIRPDWVINKHYVDKSVIDPKLSPRTHSIEEIQEKISDRTVTDVSTEARSIENASTDKTKRTIDD